ncbi:synaptonemal complex central element protein 3 [Antennarius striatus]|uniref:synaptonemal complex central element protein 3 n=1 Tax=Antennarius striatus TaxID=241820 RepID=UPI0035AEE025
MADFKPPELPQNDSEDLMGLNKDLERMSEDVENISVQLTCMIYDTVVLRTSPELAAAMLKLEAAYRRCRAAVCGDQQSETDQSPGSPSAAPPQT